MSHPLGVSRFSGGKCNNCCLDGLCYVSSTLHMCTTLQQHCGISLLHKQGYTAKVFGKTVALLGLSLVLLIGYNLAKRYQLIK